MVMMYNFIMNNSLANAFNCNSLNSLIIDEVADASGS